MIWHATGNNPWRGDHRGFDKVVDYLVLVGERTDRFDANLNDVLVSDSRIMMLFDVTVAVGNLSLDVGYQLLARLDGDRVVEVWTSPLDPNAIEQFWRKALH